MPLVLPNARQYQGARGTRAQGSVSSREVVVLKSTSSTEAEPAALRTELAAAQAEVRAATPSPTPAPTPTPTPKP